MAGTPGNFVFLSMCTSVLQGLPSVLFPLLSPRSQHSLLLFVCLLLGFSFIAYYIPFRMLFFLNHPLEMPSKSSYSLSLLSRHTCFLQGSNFVFYTTFIYFYHFYCQSVNKSTNLTSGHIIIKILGEIKVFFFNS